MDILRMNLRQVRNFICEILKEEFGYYALDQDESFYLKGNNVIVFVDTLDWGQEDVLVRVFSLVVKDVEHTSELTEYLQKLNTGTIFGKAYWRDGVVFLEHFLLGNILSPEVLLSAIYAIGGIAEREADSLVRFFGGKLLVDGPSSQYPLC